MIEVVPTVVPASLDDVVRATEAYRSFAHTIHVDVADGKFAPNTTWVPLSGERLPDGMRYEIHLMTEAPRDLGTAFLKAGAERIIGHVEAMNEETSEVFTVWRAAGARNCGLGSLYDTPIASLAPYVPLADFVMFMGITAIGVQGLPADPKAPAHAAALRARYPQTLIEVDGAVSEKNIAELAQGGAVRFCAGSVIAKAPDPEAMYRRLIDLAQAVL